ncbi:hypothetical protein N6H18_02685 [Reichenbachiella agarivorans]|uniref:Lipoprotein n=1 Tax=Reichenbachiella agarivorans TaxID=2979464 RepID=A0ABY6CQU0_9BACT|nr:hypothetical protein [Reichenbachiella agarivorans]UXP32862.1 hypothetical protein N6H18_02685 [Reichenbachiella agarivorans]
MRKALFPILIVMCVVFCSCKDNVVCPAFQSTYILNDSMRMARYSMFLNDSTPKMAVASNRSKYGVNKKSTLFKKNYDLMTAPKVNVLGEPKKDPLYADDVVEEEFLASDFVDQDTVGVDSLSAAPLLAAKKTDVVRYKYRYNVKNPYNQEQEYYNKYYGELFIDTRPTREELAAKAEAQVENDTTSESGNGKWGLFKKKKDETVTDDTDETEVDTETLNNAIESEEISEEPEEEIIDTEEE